MTILALGDVCGETGVAAVERGLRPLMREHSPDIVIINGENCAGRGITKDHASRLLRSGADLITLGNHALAKWEIFTELDENRNIIRPHNFPANSAGLGHAELLSPRGNPVRVMNLMGLWYSDAPYGCENPFFAAEKLLKQYPNDIWIVDFHAESTAEKQALGYYLDGRVSAVFGSHTHVQTADAKILPRGTGYITDVGFCGARESVIGVDIRQATERFTGGAPGKLDPATGEAVINGAVFEIDEGNGKCVAARAINS